MKTFKHPAVGAVVDFSFEPYHRGKGEITDVQATSREGELRVTITVLEGTEVSRLFQHTSTKSIAGREMTVQVPEQWVGEGKLLRYVYPV
jgi:hypothetical protein